MAATILFVFSLCVLCCTVLSLPVLKTKSVESDDRFERTLEVTSKVLTPDKVTEVAVSFEPLASVDMTDVKRVESLRRVKRQVITFHGCPDGTIWYAKRCMLFEE